MRAPMLTSRVTRGSAWGSAWSLCRWRAVCRSPGTSPYRAKQTASRTLVLPAPVSPVSRNRPPADSSSKSTLTVSANGPNAVALQLVQPHRRPSRTRSRSSGQHSRASRSSADSASDAGPPRTWRTKSRVTSWALLPEVGTRSGAGSRPDGGEPQGDDVREPGAQSVHGSGRPARVGERGLDPGGLGCGVRRRGEQVVEGALERGQASRDGRLDELGGGDAGGVEVDQPRALDVVGLGEGVGDRRAAVAHGVAEHRPTVQVAERRVVDAVEQLARHRRDATDGDVALAVAGHAADHERVRHHHGPHAGPGRRGRRGRAPSRAARAAWCDRAGRLQRRARTSGSR